jgi:hypothetical protein
MSNIRALYFDEPAGMHASTLIVSRQAVSLENAERKEQRRPYLGFTPQAPLLIEKGQWAAKNHLGNESSLGV